MKMEELIDISYDEHFAQIESLKWHPWIGRKYNQSNRKLLIVGESHYLRTKDDLQYKEKFEKSSSNKSHTRCCIYESPICKKWKNSTYRNISKLFLRTNKVESKLFWEQVAYHNFVQKIMDYRKKQRPKKSQFALSWKPFIDILDVINPTDCIFIGVSASNTFNQEIMKLGVPHTKAKWLKKVGNTYPRKSTININGRDINILFVKHTSQFFSWDKWNKLLFSENPEVMNEFYKIL